ncbi:head GIN domain-containing protein [Roseivirga misakiensis]|uniref:Putative auto-transporter adhesin head GIN domain-containing protein n=1 Tax=Roseivirga misakiensis TaxID=1563681 RepID=A0A1E5T015_9BACT|nr:head GIN domain-containing protein [Roseivirga misakiensis]OEK04647.1 hypothetical protein BFP71_14420 [Roseivirga misakiensis]
MKLKNLIYLLAICLLASSCDEVNINASGPIITEDRTVATFTSINSSLPGNIIVSQGQDQQLSIVTHSNVLDHIESKVVNGVLELEIKGSIRNLDQLDIYITAPDFEEFRLSGAAKLNTESCLELDDLEVHLSGATSTNLCGLLENLTLHLSGASSFRGYDLMAQDVNVYISGAGEARVMANELLDVNISGAAKVRYKGNPEIRSDISGAGSLVNDN